MKNEHQSTSTLMRMCWNWNGLAAAGVIGAVLFLALSPARAFALSPLLLFALCPLAMLFMMGKKNGKGDSH